MSWLSVGVTAASAVYQGVKGAQQRAEAKKLKNSNYIPPSIAENQQLAKLQANATMYPGQEADKAALERNVANSAGYAARTLKSGGDVLNLTSALNTQKNNALTDMSKRFQQYKSQSLQRLMQANQQTGNIENQNYQQFVRTRQALLSAGDQNIYGGLTTLAGAAMLKNANGLPPAYSNYYGGYRKTPLSRMDASQGFDFSPYTQTETPS